MLTPTRNLSEVEVSKSKIECFNTEISSAISDMSSLLNDAAETDAPASTVPIKPTILFTSVESADEPNEEFSYSAPPVESSPTGSNPLDAAAGGMVNVVSNHAFESFVLVHRVPATSSAMFSRNFCG